MTFDPPTECRLCGNTDKRELHRLRVHWREAEPGMAYEHVGRCRDEASCRSRVAAIGDAWPLAERGNAA